MKKFEMTEDQMVLATWLGYITAKHFDWVELTQEYYGDKVETYEFPSPPEKFHNEFSIETMCMSMAFADMEFNADKLMGNFIESFEDDFDLELNPGQYEQAIQIGKDAWDMQYETFTGYHSSLHIELEEWTKGILSGEDRIMNEVNDLLK